MKTEPTKDEMQAAQGVAEAILRFLVVHEDARRTREEQSLLQSVPQALARIEPERRMELPPEKRLLTSREVASLLSINARTVWAMTEPHGSVPVTDLFYVFLQRSFVLSKQIESMGTLGSFFVKTFED